MARGREAKVRFPVPGRHRVRAPLLPRALSSAGLRLVEVDRVGPFARLVYDVIR